MEDKKINRDERLRRLRDALIELDKEASALSREGGDIRRDIAQFLDKSKVKNVVKIIENIK